MADEYLTNAHRYADVPAEYLDAFTRIYNRYFLYNVFPEKIRAAAEQGVKMALFMVDLDNFKAKNDTYGHLVGDKVILNAVRSLDSSLREQDYLVRYAGDEFLVILTDVDLDTARSIGDRLVREVGESSCEHEGKTIVQTVSMGFAMFPDDARDVEGLIEKADQSLYLIKESGKNSCAYFQDVNLSQISRKLAMDVFPCHTFIDRDDEIDLIKKGIAEAQALGAPRGAVLHGESGVGKSRLLKEAAQYAAGIGLDVFLFNTQRKSSLAGYHLVARAFEGFVRTVMLQDRDRMSALLQGLPPHCQAVLAHFVPAIRDCVEAQGESDLGDAVIREAFSAFLRAVAGSDRTLFFAVDNLQYADTPSLDFVTRLLTKETDISLYVCAAFLDPLPEDLPNANAIRKAASLLGASQSVSIIEVRNLIREDADAMVEALFPGIASSDPDILKLTFMVTQGQPFFIEELFKYLSEKNCIIYENRQWRIKAYYKTAMPGSLHELLRYRLENLDPQLKEMIFLSSVVGEDISPRLLSKINQASEGDILEILDKAKRQKLIAESDGGFGFASDLFRDATLKEMPEEKRKVLSGKVSDALMDTYKDNIEVVSYQLASMFSSTEDVERLNRFSKIIAERTSEVFDASELSGYLDSIASRKEPVADMLDRAAELQDGDVATVAHFLSLFQGAVKDFRLYPAGSRIRENIAEGIFTALADLHKHYDVIAVSEVEKSLVVNRRRINSRMAQFVNLDEFLRLLMERDLRSICFARGIAASEISRFFEVLSLAPEEIQARGAWPDILVQEQLAHVSINKAFYAPPAGRSGAVDPVKSKLEDAMVLDFILGKATGKDAGELNLSTMARENPELLSEGLQKAVELARKSEHDTSSLEALGRELAAAGGDFGAGTVETAPSLPGAEEPSVRDGTGNQAGTREEPGQKLIDTFMSFDPRARSQLIRKSGADDATVRFIFGTAPCELISRIFREIAESGESVWAMRQIRKIFKKVTSSFERTDTDGLLDVLSAGFAGDDDVFQYFNGGKEWDETSISFRVGELTRMTKFDFEMFAENDLKAVINEVLKRGDTALLNRLTVTLRKHATESDPRAETVIQGYVSALQQLSMQEEGARAVKIAVRGFITALDEDIPGAEFEFMLSLLLRIDREIGVLTFKAGDHRRLQSFLLLWRALERERVKFGSDAVDVWKKRFPASGMTADIFSSWMDDVTMKEGLRDSLPELSRFLATAPSVIVEGVQSRLKKSFDPFERFVILKKLKDIVGALDGGLLAPLTAMAVAKLDFDDCCTLLSYADSGALAAVLQDMYARGGDVEKTGIVRIIDKTSCREAVMFLSQEMNGSIDPALKKQIGAVVQRLGGQALP